MSKKDFRGLLTPSEVAELFQVHPKTVTRWARQGRIMAYRTPGGQHRFDEREVRAYLREMPPTHTCG